MSRFEAWAPHASSVEVVLDGGRHLMSPTENGWFAADVPGAGPGTRYRFSLDGADPVPDPRSNHQPEGVHGPSEVVDHATFPWSDGEWRGCRLEGLVVYELHVGTFTADATFDAVVGRLPHLLALGVTAIELMPIAEFPGKRGWGYDGVDLYAPHHGYGGPQGLKRLVDACHRAGMAVLLDVVYNHVGPDGNYLEKFGPYFTDRYRTPWGRAVNFDDAGSDEVRHFIVENALYWLRDYHLDGLRLDAVHTIYDISARHILEELTSAVAGLSAASGRELLVIAESDLNDPRVVRPRADGGLGCDAQWSDDLHHALHAYFTGERRGYYGDFGSLEQVVAALRHGFVYRGQHSAARNRIHGRPPSAIPTRRLLAYTQSHDQVGNRAAGDRLGLLLDLPRLRLFIATVLLSPFTPMLFMGEEWGASTPFLYFTDHADAGLAEKVYAGRLNEFAGHGWDAAEVPDPQARGTFERSRLDWSELEQPQARGLMEWYGELLALRRRLADAPACGEVELRSGMGWILLRRGDHDLAFNYLDIPLVVEGVRGTVVLAGQVQAPVTEGRLALAPHGVAVTRN
ncbi:MAG: malto-oligosyltrehalose trehalohydrolase [Candidatus Dormibacteria bacterium]